MTSSSADQVQLLNVHPLQFTFPFELRKQVSCSLQVSNQTDHHVAFKVKTTNPKNYCVRPNTGIVLPQSTSEIVVTMQAQKGAPPDMQCRDKFLIQSVVTSPGTTAKDVTPEMFNKESGKVEECRMKVVFVAPSQPPSPVGEGSEENLSPRSTTTENGNERIFSDSHETMPEAKSLVAKLTEDKAAAIKQGTKLRQELELLKHKNTKIGGGGASITLVIIIALLGAVLGYFIKI